MSKPAPSYLNSFDTVEFDDELSLQAVEVAQGNHLATLDSIHLASALRIRSTRIAFITYDKQLAKAARKNSLKVLGV